MFATSSRSKTFRKAMFISQKVIFFVWAAKAANNKGGSYVQSINGVVIFTRVQA
jgi:hypothetical protein